MIYTVKSGDTLSSVSKKLKTTPARLIADNGIVSPDTLSVGEDLVVRYPSVTYTVKDGDTLSKIADEYGIGINEIYRNNPALGGLPDIYPGQTLVISFTTSPSLGKIMSNGYAYPYIDVETLRKTLPYLTYISIFAYGIKDDGELVFPDGDEKIIGIAKEYGTVPLMMLTSIGPDRLFSDRLISKILSDGALAEKIAEKASSVMNEKGYGGIDVDFEYIEGSLSGAYADFLKTLKSKIGDGKVLFASLAPKESGDMKGLLYEGHDYRSVGAVADKMLVMTYEWGYTYGPPMAVSPLNKVRQVMTYAASEIPPSKLFMGVPNYGYDWTLPFIKGESVAKSLSNDEALALAKRMHAEIKYDYTAASPYFEYYTGGRENPVKHVVWFENAKSVDEASRLAFELGISGISVWNIMKYCQRTWSVFDSLFSIVKLG